MDRYPDGHNVGMGMVPHKKNCRCNECEVFRLRQEAYDLQAKVEDLTGVLQAAVDCGMVPVTSAKEGGAARFSEQVRVADSIRAALPQESE